MTIHEAIHLIAEIVETPAYTVDRIEFAGDGSDMVAQISVTHHRQETGGAITDLDISSRARWEDFHGWTSAGESPAFPLMGETS